MIETFGTNKIEEDKIEELVEKHFDMRPRMIINRLNLLRPIYKKTASYGHFGGEDPDFTWENKEMAKILKDESGL